MHPLNQYLNAATATRWRLTLATAAIIFIGWSFAPFSYAVGVSGTHFSANMGFFFLYEFCLAMALVLMLATEFHSVLTYLFLGVSVISAVAGFSTAPLVMILLLLLPVFTALLAIDRFDLQNGFGLFTFGALLALTASVGCAYTSLHFVSWEIVVYLLPVIAANWCFLLPFFVERGTKQTVLLLISAALLIVSVTARPWRLPLAAAIGLVLVWAVFNLIKKAPRPTLLLTSLVEMLVLVFTYWS